MNDDTSADGEGTVTVGLDLGDKYTQLCMIDADGELLEEARLRTTPAALRRPRMTAAAARRSSMRELVQEPMKTLSMAISLIGVLACKPM